MVEGSFRMADPPPPNFDSPEAGTEEEARGRGAEPLLAEVAWEAVNPVGGIYTVLRSKLTTMMERWGRRYCVVGPYKPESAAVEFEPAMNTGPFGQAVKDLRDAGLEAYYGTWLVSGRPQAVLLDLNAGYSELGEMRSRLWHEHQIPVPEHDALLNDVVTFGYLVHRFLAALAERESSARPILAHFHEWMGGVAIPRIRRHRIPVRTVFTTHATLLGRYIASNDPWYYDHLPFVDWAHDAARFNIEPQVRIERAAAHGSHVLTTVSNITASECEHLLGRGVDVVTPNGLNIERFTALHEFQNLHNRYKQKIHEFVMGHFFSSYSFDLDRTLYLFTSGRFEYRNKGFDLTVEALARLNWRLKQELPGRTVVAFLITRRPFRGINAEVLRSRAVLDELYRTCDHIKEEVGEKLFQAATMGKQPSLDQLVEEYWRLRLRRTQQAWKSGGWPILVTHDLVDDKSDDVLQQLRQCRLFNSAEDPVKVVYHPDFIEPSNPLWGIEYDQFVRGCHMGVFPSYYEPWGYTPLECIARGVPAVTSDVSGFGSYVLENVEDPEASGIHVLRRRHAGFDQAADQLTDSLFNLAQLERRDRIELRNRVDRGAERFDWHHLVRHYDDAHARALQQPG